MKKINMARLVVPYVLGLLFSLHPTLVRLSSSGEPAMEWPSGRVLDFGPTARITPVIATVSLHPTEDLVVAGGDDHHVCIWNLQSCRWLHRPGGHGDWIRSPAFSPDGEVGAAS